MSRLDPPVVRVAHVAARLGDLNEHVVFVGGAIAPLLVTDAAAQSLRVTDDVDVITTTTSRASYHRLEAELRARGFQHDRSEDAPICRWRVDGIAVDVMPSDPSVLGFSNRWYPYALASAETYELTPGLAIRLVSPVAFAATKLEAFRSPTRPFAGDYFASHDLEDIVALVDGRPELTEEISAVRKDVRTYVAEEVDALLAETDFLDALAGHVEPGPSNATRTEIVLGRLRRIAQLQ
ncbi:MAG: hypothetical protein AAGG50_13430 [Bacteroidota bacterium]